MDDKTPTNRKSLAGVTLTEVLTVLGILVVLSGIGYAVILGSRSRAKIASEISNLHQLAVAGSMYHEEQGEWPLSVAPLVSLKLVPKEVTYSDLDTSPSGIANDLAISIHEQCPACGVSPTGYRRSFVGPEDFGNVGRMFSRDIEPTSGAGWLVSLTQSKPGRPTQPNDKFNNPTGDYLRVLLSGSVVSRVHRRVLHAGGTVYAIPFMFADGDEAWRQKMAGGPP